MPKRKYGYYASLFVVVLLALTMVGCEQKTINQIKADPGRVVAMVSPRLPSPWTMPVAREL